MTPELQTVQRFHVEHLHDGDGRRKRDFGSPHTTLSRLLLPQMPPRSTARASLLGKMKRKVHVVRQAVYIRVCCLLLYGKFSVDTVPKASVAFRERFGKKHLRKGSGDRSCSISGESDRSLRGDMIGAKRRWSNTVVT